MLINALVDKNSLAQPFIFLLGKLLRNELPVITYQPIQTLCFYRILSQ